MDTIYTVQQPRYSYMFYAGGVLHNSSSFPLVNFEHLLSERGQVTALVDLKWADVQHWEVSRQLLNQGSTPCIPHHGGVSGLVPGTDQSGALPGRASEHGILGEQLAGGASAECLDWVAGTRRFLSCVLLGGPVQLHQNTAQQWLGAPWSVGDQTVSALWLHLDVCAASCLQGQHVGSVSGPIYLLPEAAPIQRACDEATTWERAGGGARHIGQGCHGTPGT